MKADEVGDRIKDIRQQNNLTIKDVSERVGYSYQHVFSMEKYNAKYSITSLCDVLNALGYELEFRKKDTKDDR